MADYTMEMVRGSSGGGTVPWLVNPDGTDPVADAVARGHLAELVDLLTDANAAQALDTTLQLVLAKLGDVLAAIVNLDISADSIAINSETLSLNTDQVEIILQAVRDRLPAALDADGGLKVHLQHALALNAQTIAALQQVSIQNTVNAAIQNTVETKDRYTAGQALASQAGDGTVKTFDFGTPVQLSWVMVISADEDNPVMGWADPYGGTPANGVGVPCLDRAQSPLTVQTQTVKVWAPTGCVIAVWGDRY